MRNRITPAILTISLLLTGLWINAPGQLSGQPYRISDREVSRLLDRIRNKTEGFRQNLKRALNKSRIDGTRREDNINDFVKAFEAETKRLDDHFDHHKSTAADVESAIQRAARIDTFMTVHPLDQLTQAAWQTLRSDLELLAGAYNVSWQWGADRRPPPLVESPYRVSDRQVEDIIHHIESQSEAFRQSLDSALDKSRFDGTRREDDVNSFVKEFYQETKRLHEHFDGHKSTTSDVQQVLDRASQIDQFMRRNRLTKDTQRDWVQLRSNLDELASVYNVRWQWL